MFFSLSSRTNLQPLTVSPLTRRVALDSAENWLTDWYRSNRLVEPELMRNGSRMHSLVNWGRQVWNNIVNVSLVLPHPFWIPPLTDCFGFVSPRAISCCPVWNKRETNFIFCCKWHQVRLRSLCNLSTSHCTGNWNLHKFHFCCCSPLLSVVCRKLDDNYLPRLKAFTGPTVGLRRVTFWQMCVKGKTTVLFKTVQPFLTCKIFVVHLFF